MATFGTIKSKTAFSVIETIRLNPSLDIFPIMQYSGYIGENKNKIVSAAGMGLCSHVFFVDHDLRFPPNALAKLLSEDKDIIGGLYNFKHFPEEPMVKFFKKDGEWTAKLEESSLMAIPNKVFQAAAVGGGFLLVRMSVFNDLKKPYFPMEQDEEGNRSMTEDCGFMMKAQKAGYKVWCDPTLELKHIGDWEF